MAADTRNYLSTQLEQVESTVREVLETSSEIAGMVKKAKTLAKLSRYLYRIPRQLHRGGATAKVNLNSGAIPRGTEPGFNHLTAGYISSMKMWAISDETILASMNSAQSVYTNPLARMLAEATEEMQIDDDIDLMQDGTGKLTNGASAVTTGTPSTLTFASDNDYLGVALMRPGMTVDIWDSTGATNRGSARVMKVNLSTKTITLDKQISTLVAGDLVCRAGLGSYGPSALTSGSAEWPTAPASQVEGGSLGGDSWRHGIPYAHNNSLSTYFLGVLKSTDPTLVCDRVQPESRSPLTWQMGWIGLDRVVTRRNAEVAGGLMFLTSMAQRRQIWNMGLVLSNRLVTGDNPGRSFDATPTNNGYKEEFTFCDHPARVSKRYPRDRMDAVDFVRNWGRAVLTEPQLYKDQSGNSVRPVIDSNGQYTTAHEFGFVTSFDWACLDPNAEFYIDNLAVDENY